MRLIDADKLLRDIEHYNLSDGKFQHWVEIQPTVEPKPQWIPCTPETMPEPRIDVWCNSDMGQMVGYYEENVETWYSRNYLELMVTAWMPLPEPYQEVEE